jgi:hypothetical protein
MIGLALVVGIAVVATAIGLGLGLFVAGRIGRWLNREEETDDR